MAAQRTRRLLVLALGISAIAGCASSPEAEQRRAEREAAISAILTETDRSEPKMQPKRCLADREYTSFSALDERHILFEGRSGQLWLNTLPARCPDLRHGDVLRVSSTHSFGRICRADQFAAGDYFDWPWYRRWPWQWGIAGATYAGCTFGEFVPVTETQVAEIRALLD